MRMNQKGRPLKIADIRAKIKLYRKAKLSYSEIARVLGVSRQVVTYHCQKIAKRSNKK
jgi:DNA-binding MarR family transcriptional regulator